VAKLQKAVLTKPVSEVQSAMGNGLRLQRGDRPTVGNGLPLQRAEGHATCGPSQLTDKASCYQILSYTRSGGKKEGS
jgi:hypothetical protein